MIIKQRNMKHDVKIWCDLDNTLLNFDDITDSAYFALKIDVSLFQLKFHVKFLGRLLSLKEM